MDSSHTDDLNWRLQELSKRRKMVESKSAIHAQTLLEFQAIRRESLQRLGKTVELQNDRAKARNCAFVETIDSSIQQSMREVRVDGFSSAAKDQLNEAKSKFRKHTEDTLPLWHRFQAIKLESKIKEVKQEKFESMQRSERLQQEIRREEKTKYELEIQRRELLLTLAAEQKDQVTANAKNLLLYAESRKMDSRIVNEVSDYIDEVRQTVASRLAIVTAEAPIKYQHDANTINTLLAGAPLSTERNIDTSHYRPFDTSPPPLPLLPSFPADSFSRSSIPREATIVSTKPEQQYSVTERNQQEPSSHAVPSSSSSQQLSHIDAAPTTVASPLSLDVTEVMEAVTASQTLPSQPPSHPLVQQSPVSVSVPASPCRTPISPLKHLRKADDMFIPDPNHVSLNQQPSSLNNASMSSNQTLLPSEESDPTSMPPTVPSTDPAPGRSLTTTQRELNSPLHLSNPRNSSVPTTDNKGSESAATTDIISNIGDSNVSNDRNSSSFSGVETRAAPSPSHFTASSLSSSRTGSGASSAELINRSGDLPGPLPASASSVDTSMHNISTSGSCPVSVTRTGPEGAGASSPPLTSLVDIATNSGEVKAATADISDSRDSDFDFDVDDPVAAPSPSPAPTASVVEPASPTPVFRASKPLLQTHLTASECAHVLKHAFPCIENGVLFAEVGDVYSPGQRSNEVADTTSLHRDHDVEAYDFIDTLRRKKEDDDVSDPRFKNNELLGRAVLMLVRLKASVLIPKEAFVGVVTLDKLKKEYKKNAHPAEGAAVQRLWDLLLQHIQALVEINRSYLDHVSAVFTAALVVHIDLDDRDRFTRKVSNLLQLAAISRDGDSRSPSPPYRAKKHVSPLSSMSLLPSYINGNSAGAANSSAINSIDGGSSGQKDDILVKSTVSSGATSESGDLTNDNSADHSKNPAPIDEEVGTSSQLTSLATYKEDALTTLEDSPNGRPGGGKNGEALPLRSLAQGTENSLEYSGSSLSIPSSSALSQSIGHSPTNNYRNKYPESIAFETFHEGPPVKKASNLIANKFDALTGGDDSFLTDSNHGMDNITFGLGSSSGRFSAPSKGTKGGGNPTRLSYGEAFSLGGEQKGPSAAEFDDDEIESDEEMHLPPPIKDLGEEQEQEKRKKMMEQDRRDDTTKDGAVDGIGVNPAKNSRRGSFADKKPVKHPSHNLRASRSSDSGNSSDEFDF